MNINSVSSPIDIAISGMRAEWQRMGIVSNNIANAKTTRTASGLPYCRQDIVLSTSVDFLEGITSVEVITDTSTDFKRVYIEGHPDADEQGFVLMPNVDLPVEMINMVSASRAYQANVAVLKRYQDIVEVTLELLK